MRDEVVQLVKQKRYRTEDLDVPKQYSSQVKTQIIKIARNINTNVSTRLEIPEVHDESPVCPDKDNGCPDNELSLVENIGQKNELFEEYRLKKFVEDLVIENPISTSIGVEPQIHQCSICFGNILAKDTNYLRCGHNFHKYCVKQWLLYSSICPLCRHDLANNESDTDSSGEGNLFSQLTIEPEHMEIDWLFDPNSFNQRIISERSSGLHRNSYSLFQINRINIMLWIYITFVFLLFVTLIYQTAKFSTIIATQAYKFVYN